MAGLLSKMGGSLRHAWNLFRDTNYTDGLHSYDGGYGYGWVGNPNRSKVSYSSNERTIISSIYTRLGIDVSAIDIRHVRTDEEGRYLKDIKSGLQNCLTIEPNLDQAARQFRQDIAMTLFENGVAAIVPVDSDIDPAESAGYDIQTLRVGRVVSWFPEHVTVDLYNQRKGYCEQVTVPKAFTALVENPFYSVMNEPNSTLKRLIRKLNLLDTVDEISSSGKLDLIIQLPYVIKSEARRKQAEQRRKDIEFQLKGSQYGIAYTDGTEKITQLNRSVENNLLTQVEYLTKQLYAELGLTEEVMNGTADEKAMLNYFNRTIEPVVQAIAESMKRTFLTKTARSQNQTIMYFRDAFKLVPMEQLAEIVDKFTRNEVLSSNEIRQAIGIKPSKDPKADKLINSNMPQAELLPGTEPLALEAGGSDEIDLADDALQRGLDEVNGIVDSIFAELGIEDG